MARMTMVLLASLATVMASGEVCSVSKDKWDGQPGNCTAANELCCPGSGWDWSSNYTRFLGHCYDSKSQVCVIPQPHCSPCVSVPCVRVCPKSANYSCNGECMNPESQTCCGGVICQTAKGEACARATLCEGGSCCGEGTFACTSDTYGSPGLCCKSGSEKCGKDNKGYAVCLTA
eukprot:Hpha_TRINITY_DN27298_c0_g1::TRINITY_DN27298_c0_g1_i1::g.140833::m.140833